MDERQFKERTKGFALRIIRLVDALPPSTTAQVIGRQLLRCGTSVGANYRAACRAKSTPDWLHKLAIVEEEADESLYWMELLIEADIIPQKRLEELIREGNELLAMLVSSIKTARAKQIQNPKSKIQN